MEQRGFRSRVLDRLIGFVLVLTNIVAIFIIVPLYLIVMIAITLYSSIRYWDWDWRIWSIIGEGAWLGIRNTCSTIHMLATQGFQCTWESMDEHWVSVNKELDEIFDRW